MAVIAGKHPYTFSLQQAQREMTMTGGAAAFFSLFFPGDLKTLFETI